MTNFLLQLKTLGQSVWLNDIDREHLLSGLFGRLIEGDEMTSQARRGIPPFLSMRLITARPMISKCGNSSPRGCPLRPSTRRGDD
ncbi:hypothetical protein KSC_107470 [Ktedonobacter sp. SOSP1-52]|uniref:hypothetical protein n=1 Tax=Ktedonobacter sp. SOSP1-52 TaxID=2778366 RepID=UPI001914E20E|nr:hypothetical protein [Ktedonobacter sp. SOSP1-52]GHO71855.1 hypothetical protein KSC_107470 [Ktedonobacter sp. SOSP1-52]